MNATPPGLLRTPEGIYVLERDSHLSRWVEEHKRLDISDGQIAFYARHIPAGGTVIDAGACIGDYTATCAKLVGPNGVVFALEPNPLAYQALQLNFACQYNVAFLNYALSDKAGFARLKPEHNAGASFISEQGDVTVGVTTIDDLPLERLDFIHLDLEGFELKALCGGAKMIAKFRPVIVLEINHPCLARNGITEADVLGELATQGYRWEEIEPHLNSTYQQRDIICFPK